MTNTKLDELAGKIAVLYPDLVVVQGAPLSRFLASGQLIAAAKGTHAFQKGDECKNYILVLEGRVRVQLTSAAGKEVTLYHVRPGGSCAITTACLIGGDEYPAEAYIESDIVAAAFPKAAFQQTITESEQFREFVFSGFAKRLSSVIGVVDSVALMSVDERLSRALLAIDKESKIDITHQKLASEIGSAREVVSRRLKHYENQGLIVLGRGQVEVLDHAALLAMCDPE